jgi:hypothetical protein
VGIRETSGLNPGSPAESEAPARTSRRRPRKASRGPSPSSRSAAEPPAVVVLRLGGEPQASPGHRGHADRGSQR